MGPFGCIPMIKALFPETKTACVDKVKTLAKLHNKAFSTLLQELERQLKDFKYSMINILLRAKDWRTHQNTVKPYI